MQGEYEVVKELTRRYAEGNLHLDERDAQRLAEMAYHYGIDFEVQGKALRKGLFDAADMASFGMLPNEWRPRSPGQDLHGEPGFDKLLGGAGTLLGLGTGIVGGAKLATKGYGALRGTFETGGKGASAIARVKEMEALKRARDAARRYYNNGKNYLDPVPNFMDFRYPI